ncbi:MAG: FMN-binding protein [Peptococcaceae bacterium]|nr:FMN-binding protein [Peptococcaceae bacterium]
MGFKMVALCAAAAGIIYGAGYTVTDTPAASYALNDTPSVVAYRKYAQTATKLSVPQQEKKVQTEPKTVTFASSTASTKQPAQNPSSTQNPSTVQSPSTTQSPSSAQSSNAAPSAKQQGQYKDGTYYGQGSNRIGTVGVAVTVKQGRIVSAQITQCDTHYPQWRIDPVLPDQVVAKQNGNIDAISGATRSSEDFQVAVQTALQQAQL